MSRPRRRQRIRKARARARRPHHRGHDELKFDRRKLLTLPLDTQGDQTR